MVKRLTHVGTDGRAQMVDVSAKPMITEKLLRVETFSFNARRSS